MLPRSIIRQHQALREQTGTCIICQHVAFHSSSLKRKRAERTPSTIGRNRTWIWWSKNNESLLQQQRDPKLARDTRNISNLARQSNIRREDANARTTETFNETGGSPQGLLEKAYSDGALEIEPTLVGGFLEELTKYGHKLTPANLRNACAKFSISIDAAYTLGRLLVRSPGPVDQFQGRQILLLASQLGSAKATLFVIKTAAKSKQLNKQEVQPSLKQLQKLVEQDPPIIPALVAQALVYEQEQEFKAAEELYRKALDSTPPKGKPSLLARVVSRLKERLSSADTDAITEKKIIVEDKDTELDMAAAHLGLAEIQYYRTYDYENALKNWEIAALNYDDPEAYYKITQHLEAVAKNDNKDLLDDNDPVEHNCLRFVPYKWYEYMMKAAASGHAEACYKIGLFLMLARRGYSKQITDRRLRNALANSPLMKQSPWPARVGNPEKYSEERNQVHVIDRWFSAACQLGYTPAEISLALLWLDQKSTPLSPESHVRNVLWIATRGRFVDMQSEDMQLSMNDQEKAIKLYKWLIRTERVQTIVRDAKMTSPKERSLNQRDIIECLKKLPRSIQQL